MSARALATSVAPGYLQRASALTDFSGSESIPVSDEIGFLLPWPGLRRGATVSIAAQSTPGTTSLLLTLMAQVSRSGGWCAITGNSAVSAVTAHQVGVSLSRLAFIEVCDRGWESVTGALLNGIDLVAVYVAGAVSQQVARALMAKARKRGNILVPFGPGAYRWPAADASWSVEKATWHGLRWGRGMLRHCELQVRSCIHGRDRYGTVWPYGGSPGDGHFGAHMKQLASVTSLSDHKARTRRSR